MPGKVDFNKIAARYAQLNSGQFWTPKEGMNNVRILPPWNDEGVFYKEVPSHFSVGPQNKMFVCNAKLGHGSCVVCDTVTKLLQSSSKDDVKLAEDMRVQLRVLYNIVDLDDPAIGVQIMSTGPKIFRDVLSYFADPEWGDLTDPETGYDISIQRSGTGFQTQYTVRPKKNPSPIADPDWLSQLHDLDEFSKPADEEAIANALSGIVVVPTAPKAQPVAPKAQPKVVTPVVEEEAEDVEAEDIPVDAPKCFGKMYDARTCAGCAFASQCNPSTGKPQAANDLAARIKQKMGQ